MLAGRFTRCGAQAKAGITKEIEEHMSEASKELSKSRKKRVMPEGLAAPEDIEGFAQLSSHPLHKTTKVRAPWAPASRCSGVAPF